MTDEKRETFAGWAAVPEFEGLYEVSTQGEVRRIARAARRGEGHGGGARIGRILKPQKAPGGYQVVQLWRDGRPTMRLVHVLVASAFHGRPLPGMEVNHKNGIKTDNCASNLEWMTRSDNLKHAYQTGLMTPVWSGRPSPRRKPRVRVPCACGCGDMAGTPDRKGRARRLINGHNQRRAA
jgi:hypothetical protein